jgi:hypothetical protein
VKENQLVTNEVAEDGHIGHEGQEWWLDDGSWGLDE